MTDTPERALLRRLMEARRAFHNGPSTPEKFAEWDAALAAADALLAQPAPEGAKPQGPLKQYIRWPYVGEDGKWHIGELDVESPRVTRFFLDGALMKIAPEGNQCDGCRAGMPLYEGIHYRDDHPHICCTADRYTQPAPEVRSPHPEEMGHLFVGRTRVDEVQSRLRKPTPPAARVEALVEQALRTAAKAERGIDGATLADVDAAKAALLAACRPPYDKCGVCCGEPLKSGRECICGGVGTKAAEMHGLRVHCFELQDKLDAASRPLSRAEAEAMVEAYDHALSRWDWWSGHEYRDYYKVRVDEAEAELTAHRSALLRALTGEGT